MTSKINRFTDEEKRLYIELYLSGKHSLRELAAMAGTTATSINRWVKHGTISKRIVRYDNVKNTTSPTPIDPRDAEIARLRAALEKAELRAHALDTMIDIAEDKLKISIRKKHGAKQ